MKKNSLSLYDIEELIKNQVMSSQATGSEHALLVSDEYLLGAHDAPPSPFDRSYGDEQKCCSTKHNWKVLVSIVVVVLLSMTMVTVILVAMLSPVGKEPF